MSDPRELAADLAGSRAPQWMRILGWALSVFAWAAASDGRPLVALLSLVVAAVIRYAYVVLIAAGRAIFWSAWFFAVAAVCELAWLFVISARV
jgi:hypothetical protein